MAPELRLSISTSYWPLAWPPPRPVTLSIQTGPSCLEVPVRHGRDTEPAAWSALSEPEGAPELATTQVQAGDHDWRVERDLVSHESSLHIVKDRGVVRIDDTETEVTSRTDEWYRVCANDPESARGETRTLRRFVRDDWGVEVRTRSILTCTTEAFTVHAQLDAYELDQHRGDPRVYSQTWVRTIPRDLV